MRLDREVYVLRYFPLDGYSIQRLTGVLSSTLMLLNVVLDIRIRIELAVISGDSLVLRGSPGPQGQPPKERCVSSSLLLLLASLIEDRERTYLGSAKCLKESCI